MYTNYFKKHPDPLFVFGAGFLFYLFHMMPGIGFGDAAIIVDNVNKVALNTEVNTHALMIAAGQLFRFLPVGDLAYRLNLMSAVFASFSLALFYSAIRQLFKDRSVAAITTAALAVSYSFFWHATIVENYIISAFLNIIALYFYVMLYRSNDEKWVYGLFFLFGPGLFNHVQMGFYGAGVGFVFLVFYQKSASKSRYFLKSLAAFMAGMLPWLAFFARDVSHSAGFQSALKNAFTGPFGGLIFGQKLIPAIADFVIIYIFQYPNLFIALPFVGIYYLFQSGKGGAVFAGPLLHMLLNTIFFMFYGTWDKFAFLLQSFVILTFFGSFAIVRLKEFHRYNLFYTVLLLSILVSPYFYDYVERNAAKPNGFWYPRYNNEYSGNLYNQAGYIVNPSRRNYREVEIYCGLVFEKLPQNSIMVEDDSRTYYPLVDYYQKYYKIRPDIRVLLINSFGIAGWGLDANGLYRVIENGLSRGKPVFLPALKFPYAGLIKLLKESGGYHFEKFYLSESRWIYQIVSASGSKARKDENVTDLNTGHFVKNMNVSAQMQYMYEYGDSWESGDQIFFHTNNGDALELQLPAGMVLTGNTSLYFTKAPDFGMIDVYLDNKPVLTGVDLYHERVVRSKYTFKNTGGQVKTLTIKVTGKNSRSRGYKVGVDSIGPE